MKVYDLTVFEHHTVALSNGVIVSNCDEKCYGKTCGTCNFEDLKIRTGYLRAADTDVELTAVRSVDQHSQSVRVRVRITKDNKYRFVGNDHWRFAVRRACFRAQTTLGWQHGIAKRSIRFASDEVKYRDWTDGTDYVEFAFTRALSDDDIAQFLYEVGNELVGRIDITDWSRHPADAVTIRSDVDLNFFTVEVEATHDQLLARLDWWAAQDSVLMRLKVEGGYFAPTSEQVNAKDYVQDIWAVRDGHRLHVRMLLRGRPNPYNIIAALMGKASWLPFARHTATRLDAFIAADRAQHDFLRPDCRRCGLQIPTNLLDQPFHTDYCPQCLDHQKGVTATWDATSTSPPKSAPAGSGRK